MTDAAMVGKSGYERVERDAYYTPAWCTETLCRHVGFLGQIWECAAGDGRMSAVLTANGNSVMSSDISPAVNWMETIDFLTASRAIIAPNIVTNPPFKYAQPFIETARRVTEAGGAKSPCCSATSTTALRPASTYSVTARNLLSSWF